MTKIRVAVIGAGHLGKIHAKLLLENPKFELVAVCDPYASARQTDESLLNVATIADYHTLPGKVEAVVIAAPTSLHYSIASWTLRHQLHSFVEKPLTPTAAEAEALNELASKLVACSGRTCRAIQSCVEYRSTMDSTTTFH